jgi:uncharacterized protein
MLRLSTYFRALLALLILWSAGAGLGAAEVIPPPPAGYFNDYAKVVPPAAAQRMNAQLQQFERDTSSQIVCAIFPKMESDSSIEDYTVRVAESWKVGQKGANNGAVLFVFVQDRAMFLQVGYGLEGALPDAIAKQIIENEIKPHFRNGNYEAGLQAGVNAILAAVRGEYKGTGRTVAEQSGASRGHSPGAGLGALIFALFLVVFLLRALTRLGHGRVYHGRGYRSWGGGGWGGGSWGGEGWSGGGGGGGFSGGGGSFGGGGAGGRW